MIPLNAYIQKFGEQHIGSGNAVAVQNLGENSMMLSMLGCYSVCDALHVSVSCVGFLFGLVFAAIIFLLWLRTIYKKRR